MCNNVIIATMVGGALVSGASHAMAQTCSLEYICEWQTDFKGGYDWLNFLKVSAELELFGHLALQASTISTAKTANGTLIDDLLTYSNIEAGNIPLTLARLGVAATDGQNEFFLGVSNVNEDYFTSDLTSYFTNSSCGISPTISCNYDIANYPLAALCAHYHGRSGRVSYQTSLYPGRGYSRLLGHDNLFTVAPGRDGVFSISSIDYTNNGFYVVLGAALHYGLCMADVEGEQDPQAQAPRKRFSAAPWLLSELRLSDRLGLHAHVSFSTVRHGCKAYAGVGMIYSGRFVQPGVALNYASFTGTREYAAEVACRVPLTGAVCLQPALHLVTEGDFPVQTVGMMRVIVSI